MGQQVVPIGCFAHLDKPICLDLVNFYGTAHGQKITRKGGHNKKNQKLGITLNPSAIASEGVLGLKS